VQARIDNTPGLGIASGNERGVVWKLDPAVSRAVLADGAAGDMPIGRSPAARAIGLGAARASNR
jgi:hypothetical protein